MPRLLEQDRPVSGPFFATGEDELREFLGDRYTRAPETILAHQWAAASPQTPEQIEEFYKSSDGYLYRLTAWHESRRFPYAEVIGDFAARHGYQRLLDYGCGIGTDGLKLLERGFVVTFCDFRNPSTEYLTWRLAKRGLHAAILYVGEDELQPNDLTFAIDVIEHVVDPARVLKDLAARTNALIPHFPLTTQEQKHPMHFPLNKRQLRRVLEQEGFSRLWEFSQFRYSRALLQPWEAPDFWVRD